MWIVCAHESQTTKSQCGSSVLMKVKQLRTTEKQACMCIELYSDKHITLLTQIWTEWPVSYKLMPETLRFRQSKRSGYCCTRSRDLLTSAISSSICGTRISSICFRFLSTYCIYHKYQQSLQNLFIILISHGFTPRTLSTDSHTTDSHSIERKIERKISCLLQTVIKQSDSPCLLQMCVQS